MSPEDEKVIREMWKRKAAYKEVFAHAFLTKDVPLFYYTPSKKPGVYDTEDAIGKAGTKVLITMISRFGDVGIRTHDIDTPKHGYTGRVDPETLRDYKFLPGYDDMVDIA